jgi:hypothetical protein
VAYRAALDREEAAARTYAQLFDCAHFALADAWG